MHSASGNAFGIRQCMRHPAMHSAIDNRKFGTRQSENSALGHLHSSMDRVQE
jgi:hypothetical protein